MATSRLMTLHVNKGKTVAQTITDRTDYAENPEKTRKGELVTGYACDPRTVDTEFLMSKKEYFNKTGRDQGDNNIIAYHIRQAFKPGEIDPEAANKLGYALAMRFTKGRHAFIVATHEDKAHIHNHIIFNSTDIDSARKFKNFWGSSFAVRKLNDLICLENGLSVIKDPKPGKKHYGAWLGDKKNPSTREQLEQIIDKVFAEKPSGFAEFVKLLEAEGCEFKHSRRSVRLKGKKGFVRLNSLTENYTEGAIRERISGKRTVDLKQIAAAEPQKIKLLIDVQNSIKAQNSPGYERWAKVFNLKQSAKTLLFLQDNGITEIGKLDEAAQKAKDDFNEIQIRIQTADSRMKDITELQKHIGAYIKTVDVYTEYKKLKHSKKFYNEHEPAILKCKAAKAYFDEKNLEKLPTIKTLQQEYAALSSEKKKLYSDSGEAREYMQEILLARQNVYQLLNYRDTENEKDSQSAER